MAHALLDTEEYVEQAYFFRTFRQRLDENGQLVGVVTQREILGTADPAGPVADLVRMAPVAVREDDSLRDAADLMAAADVGRLPVISRDGRALVGILTRSDLVTAHRHRLADAHPPRQLLPRSRRRLG